MLYQDDRPWRIYLRDSHFDDEWFSSYNYLRALNIEELRIRETRLADSTMATLIGNQPLKGLSARDQDIGPETILALRRTEKLTQLDLYGSSADDEEFASLPLERLEWLSISGTQISPRGTLQLGRCRNLSVLVIDDTQFEAEVSEALTGVQSLRVLCLVGDTNGHELIPRICRLNQLSRLRKIILGDTTEVEEFRAAVQKGVPGCITTLHRDIESTTFDRLRRVVSLLERPSLANLSGTKVTDAGLERFSEKVHATSVNLEITPITDAGLEHLRGLKTLREMKIGFTQVTDSGLEHLRDLTNLWRLHLDGTQVTGTGLVHLSKLTKLRELVLRDTQVTDAGLQHLKELTNLRTLVLTRTHVTDAGLEDLRDLTNLRRLYLDRTQVNGTGFVHLRSLTNLEFINLRQTRVTDAGLEHLKGLTRLKELKLNGTQVTDAGLEELKATLPNCTIVHQ